MFIWTPEFSICVVSGEGNLLILEEVHVEANVLPFIDGLMSPAAGGLV